MTNVYIAGSGKLALELLNGLMPDHNYEVQAWADRKLSEPCIVIHAGSGRELKDIIAYCEQTNSVLVELSTETNLSSEPLNIPVILCPNTNILMLKFMFMLEQVGYSFSQYQINLTESHQSGKTSTPGTAITMAKSLGLAEENIESIRDPKIQREELKIPEQSLNRHAYHRIEISDHQSCSISMETKVLGNSPYAEGVRQIIIAVSNNTLEKRLYQVTEFIDKGWI